MRHTRCGRHGSSVATLGLALAMLAGCAPSPPDAGREPTPREQQPVEAAPPQCPPSGFHLVVIELAPDAAGVCQATVVTADKLPTLLTYRDFTAHWHVCNRCNDVVDVRLRSFQPSLTELFEFTSPPLGASNELVVRGVRRDGSMWGKVRRDAPRQAYYEFGWRVTGTAAWNEMDPRLEIEDGWHSLIRRLYFALDPPDQEPEVKPD
ncbi:MAG: hypothetical protein KJ066_05055 [Acidobacteria bacterium]|nr:hypothetical protein [Acidobacteriota bacterium]